MSSGIAGNALSGQTPAAVLVVDDEAFCAAGRPLARARDTPVPRPPSPGRLGATSRAHEVAPGHFGHPHAGLLRHRAAPADLPRQYPDTPVIMMTGVEEARRPRSSVDPRGLCLPLKPVQREELIFHARRALERRQLILDRRQYTRRLGAAGAGADRRHSPRPRGDHLPAPLGLACGATRRRARTSAATGCSASCWRGPPAGRRRGGGHPPGGPHARHRQDRHSRRHPAQAGQACLPKSSAS